MSTLKDIVQSFKRREDIVDVLVLDAKALRLLAFTKDSFVAFEPCNGVTRLSMQDAEQMAERHWLGEAFKAIINDIKDTSH